VQAPDTLAEFLWSLADPEQLNGEAGYYLTVMMSVIGECKSQCKLMNV